MRQEAKPRSSESGRNKTRKSLRLSRSGTAPGASLPEISVICLRDGPCVRGSMTEDRRFRRQSSRTARCVESHVVWIQVRSYRSLVACIANSILYSYDAAARASPGSHPGGRTPRLLISRSRVKPPGKYAPWRRAYATYQVRIGELQSEHWPEDSTGCSRSEMEAQTKRCTLHAGGRLPAGCLGRHPRRLDGEQIPKVSVHRTSILYRQYLGSWGACCVEWVKASYYVGTAHSVLC